MKYPTPKEIIECKSAPTTLQIMIAQNWKTDWNHMLQIDNARKQAIVCLVRRLLAEAEKKEIDVQYVENIPSSCFLAKQKKIWLKDMSIITALHETAHALYGESEIDACSWSTKMFKEIFPEEYAKLHWEGHMLKK